MPTTPKYGWVTPVFTDPNDVPTDLLSLATQIDSKLTELLSKLPAQQQSGLATINLTAAAGGTVAVTFPVPFPASANLACQVTKATASLAKYSVYHTGLSNTGVTIGVYSGDGTSGTGTLTLHWTVSTR